MESIAVLLLGFLTAAKMSWFFEPLIGVQDAGVWRNQVNAPTYLATMQGDIYGYEYGAKLLRVSSFTFLGADYITGKTTWTFNPSNDNQIEKNWARKIDGKEKSFSLLAGILLWGRKISLWAGYAPYNRLLFGKNFIDDQSALHLTGSSWKVGASFPVMQTRIRFNAEYVKGVYGKTLADNNIYGNFPYETFFFYFSYPLLGGGRGK